MANHSKIQDNLLNKIMNLHANNIDQIIKKIICAFLQNRQSIIIFYPEQCVGLITGFQEQQKMESVFDSDCRQPIIDPEIKQKLNFQYTNINVLQSAKIKVNLKGKYFRHSPEKTSKLLKTILQQIKRRKSIYTIYTIKSKKSRKAAWYNHKFSRVTTESKPQKFELNSHLKQPPQTKSNVKREISE